MKKHALTLWILMLFCLPALAAEDFDIYSVNPEDYQPMPAQSPDQVPLLKPRGGSTGGAVIHDQTTDVSIELPAAEPAEPESLWEPELAPRSGLTPLNRRFTSLMAANQITTYPRRAMVKVLFSGRGGNYSCSGTLIDRNLVITAGHCVYDYDNREMFSDFVIIPAYDYYAANSEPFGRSGATRAMWWLDYSRYADYSYDIGLIKLRTPLGDYTGWLGYGYHPSCNFLTNNTFHNYSYPGEEYQSRQMYYRYGSFDECVNFIGTTNPYKMARAWNRGIPGQSGSAAYSKNNEGNRYVYGVHSTGDHRQANFARINDNQFDQIKTFKASDNAAEKAELLLLCATRVHDYWFYGQSRYETADWYLAYYASGWALGIGKDGKTFLYRRTPSNPWIVADMDAINQNYCVPHGEGY